MNKKAKAIPELFTINCDPKVEYLLFSTESPYVDKHRELMILDPTTKKQPVFDRVEVRYEGAILEINKTRFGYVMPPFAEIWYKVTKPDAVHPEKSCQVELHGNRQGIWEKLGVFTYAVGNRSRQKFTRRANWRYINDM